MTTSPSSKHFFSIGLILSLALSGLVDAAQRAKSFDDAMRKAGEDGVVAFCYGPDWNAKSVRMLKNFWENPEMDEAAGDAILVAVPFYQDSSSEEAMEDSHIIGSMDTPPFGVCPTVLMYDKTGRLYATLVGSDYIGDEDGKLGMENIKLKLEALRKQYKLVEKADDVSGEAKAKLLTEASELGIEAPSSAASQIMAASASENAMYTKRLKYNALAFLYEQMETGDGFLAPDFIEDFEKIKKACLEIVEDPSYKPMDRQAANNLYLGALRRDGTKSGGTMRAAIKNSLKISNTTFYAKLMPQITANWTKLKKKKSSNSRKKLRDAKKAKKTNQRKQESTESGVKIS